jgi:phenylacetate-CoA ligase
VDIVRPGTGDPLPDGEVGEVVVTTFSPVYPLIRFATGDLSAVLTGASPCGRTNLRIKGWMGRADQTTKVKGMFVHPSQIAQIAARHPEIIKARLEIESDDNRDEMTLRCEVAQAGEALADAVAATLQSVCKVRGRDYLAGLATGLRADCCAVRMGSARRRPPTAFVPRPIACPISELRFI